MAFTPIADSDFNGKGALSLPDQPTISAQELKRKFDEPAREVVAPKVNNLITELEGTASAASLGAVAPTGRTGNTVQAVLNSVSSAVDSKSVVALSNVSTSGVRIATVSINGAPVDLKAPEGGSGGGTWGSITGDIDDQTDLKNALDSKADTTDIPTDVSDLNNDLGFQTASDVATAVSAKSTVSWNQITGASGNTKIATITIDSTPTDVYAPTSGGGGGATSFAGLDDVSLSGTPSAGQIVQYTTVGSDVKLRNVNMPSIPTVTDTYSGTSGDAMSGKAVKAALQTLDGSITGTPATSKTLSAFSETDGVVSATFSDISITKSQISDFPTIPTVNDATLTIQKNGTNVNTFTANASSNVTANIVTGEFIKTASVSSGYVTFTGVDDTGGTKGYDVFFDVTSGTTNKNPYAKLTSISGEGTSNCSLTYETDADNGTNTAHLYQYK